MPRSDLMSWWPGWPDFGQAPGPRTPVVLGGLGGLTSVRLPAPGYMRWRGWADFGQAPGPALLVLGGLGGLASVRLPAPGRMHVS